MAERVWTISNILSFLRLVLVAPIVLLLMRDEPGDRLWVFALMLAAVATDFFDGLMARRLGQETGLGKIIDPVADKVAVGAVGVALALLGRIPVWFLAAALLRDALILAGGLAVRRSRGILLQSNKTGKWTVVVMAAYLLLAAVGPVEAGGLAGVLLWASCIMMLVSAVVYARRMFNVLGGS